MRNLILALPILLASAGETYSQALPGPSIDGRSAEAISDPPGALPPQAPGVAEAGLEGSVKGHHVVLDWTAAARPPAEFRILHPGGRLIATRLGKRSVQGWMSTVRVAGWPRGVYLVEVRSGDLASTTKFLVP